MDCKCTCVPHPGVETPEHLQSYTITRSIMFTQPSTFSCLHFQLEKKDDKSNRWLFQATEKAGHQLSIVINPMHLYPSNIIVNSQTPGCFLLDMLSVVAPGNEGGHVIHHLVAPARYGSRAPECVCWVWHPRWHTHYIHPREFEDLFLVCSNTSEKEWGILLTATTLLLILTFARLTLHRWIYS